MKRSNIINLSLAVLGLCMLFVTGSAIAETYTLSAERGCLSMPDGATVPLATPCPAGTVQIWGLKNTNAGQNPTGRWLFEEGQALAVTNGTLTVTLTNTLGVPVSLWLPGQTMTNNAGPVWFNSPTAHSLPADPYAATTASVSRPNLTARVRSFAHEVAPTATGAFTWGTVKPGTFILQSGTQPSLQVPMGLYGAVIVTDGAYPGTDFDVETLLLFSEIDPAINNGVTYANAGLTGTFQYHPRFFLVNGKPFTPAVSAKLVGTNAQTTLVRLANAGLFNHTAMMLGEYMTVMAEDGNIYPTPKQNALNTVLLTAGKTIDAFFTPTAAGYYPIFDRRLYVANDNAPSGGMLSYLRVPSTDVTLNVATTVAGPGTPGGKVIAASMPGGIQCLTGTPLTNDCSEVVNTATNMALQAVPNAGSTYRWTTVGAGACPRAKGICELAGVTGATPVSAEFRPLSYIGLFRNADWIRDLNGNGVWDLGIDGTTSFGLATDVPIAGDWNGNGISKIGVFRNGTWYLDTSGDGVSGPGDGAFNFGLATDVPVVGDWTGDGITKIGLFRGGNWYLDTTGDGIWGAGDSTFSFGLSTDLPIVGDWNGSGVSKIGLFRNGNWYLDYNGNGAWDGCGAPADPTKDVCFSFGSTGDTPIVFDWNSDGKSKIGVFRNGNWYFDYNGNGTWNGCGAPADPTKDACFSFGLPTDKPVVAGW